MSRTRPSPLISLCLIVVVVGSIGGRWWVLRPKRSAEHFISLLSQGQPDQAASVLRTPSSIETDGSGMVTIKATDGTTAKLTVGELPLVPYGDRADRDWSATTGMGDYLAGRYRFRMSTSGPALKGGQKKPAIVYCVAKKDQIAIDAIREQVSDWGVQGFRRQSEADQVGGIDYGTVAYAFIREEPGFVIWTDTSPSAGDSNIRKSDGGVAGAFRLADGRTMDFRYEPRYAEPGTVRIGGKEYNCADGSLFLIRAGREVKQLHCSLSEFAGIPDDEFPAREELAQRYPEISSFYEPNAKKSRTSRCP